MGHRIGDVLDVKKGIGWPAMLCLLPIVLTGCAAGEKGGSLTAVYAGMAVLAMVLLVIYCIAGQTKKAPWFLLLFTSILVVNIGYLTLAVSRNVGEALMANRVAYLGSVFLPLSMWMIIARVGKIRYPKWLPVLLAAISIIVFLVAASPGILPIYYKEVNLVNKNGVMILDKTYGPLHGLYLVYLLGYFGAMVGTIIYATIKKKIESTAYAVILAIAVLVNIIVWGIEQLVDMDFEILSISYIISESFLLGLLFLMAETEKQKMALQAQQQPVQVVPEDAEQMEIFRDGLGRLTPKEREIYDCYLAGMATADVMEALSIKENTLKFHNKNLYGKLGVSSRKQLLRFAALQQHQTGIPEK